VTVYLPDTNIWSRFLRGHSDDWALRDRVERFLPLCRLSAIALMELEYGAAKRPDVPAFRDRILRLSALFPRVASFDAACAHHAGVVRAHLAVLRPNAQPIGPFDALLAGQAIALGAIFVTDNVREFRRVPGLTCENWRA
jgi:tRNA(fMet)-specific endonuclease VapC